MKLNNLNSDYSSIMLKERRFRYFLHQTTAWTSQFF